MQSIWLVLMVLGGVIISRKSKPVSKVEAKVRKRKRRNGENKATRFGFAECARMGWRKK